jgi:hypothetical protein
MKSAAVSKLLLIPVFLGLSINPLMASGDEEQHGKNDQNVEDRDGWHHGHDDHEPKSLGVIEVGPSASGEAVRILSTQFTLRPLTWRRCRSCLGIVVGRADLFNKGIAVQLRAAYEAGHGVAVTNAKPATIDRLHDLLGHRGAAHPPQNVATADLAGFRKAFRADGQRHSVSQLLLPRTTSGKPTSGLSRRERYKRARMADANDLKAMERIFSATAIVPTAPLGAAATPQNLVNLAESYETHGIQSDENGDQVQLINTIWSARSFQNSSDFYYVNQEVDYNVNRGVGKITSWVNDAGGNAPYANVTLITPSPQTTLEATQVTSGVSTSIGTSVGFNETQGFNASVTQTTTISKSNSFTVPALDITNNADFGTGAAEWAYKVNDLSAGGALDLYNNWIWQVPFASYAGATQGQLVMNFAAHLDATLSDVGLMAVSLTMSSLVPWPFGETFQIQPPTVTAVNPSCVDSGDSFTITGSGLYPSLIQSVIINGTPVVPQAITTISDTQTNIIAPSTIQCHFGCPVVVQTNEGTSNTNQSIEISAFCGN